MPVSLKIYYLDDEPDLLEAFQDTFADQNTEVITFESAPDLLAAVAQSVPQLVILDFRLHRTTGDQVAKDLPPELPKILVTGDLQVKLESKFDTIIEKPWKEAQVREVLERYRKT